MRINWVFFAFSPLFTDWLIIHRINPSVIVIVSFNIDIVDTANLTRLGFVIHAISFDTYWITQKAVYLSRETKLILMCSAWFISFVWYEQKQHELTDNKSNWKTVDTLLFWSLMFHFRSRIKNREGIRSTYSFSFVTYAFFNT